jgi:putative toxin-antitoxin system antitoxin component (TIGR02293 family)
MSKSTKNDLKVSEAAVKYHATQNEEYKLVEQAHAGVPASAFFDILSFSGLTKEELSGLLDVSFKTIQRYHSDGKKLNALNSEQLLKIITLYQKAEEIFGDLESFNRWLRKPAIGLGNRKPLKYLQTPGGIDLIMDELHRIEHGALA